ncbi:helix-turn-helix domain-containing protein [Niallia sp. FSL R7-0271]
MTYNRELRNKIYSYRKALNMTITQLAKLSGMSQGTFTVIIQLLIKNSD